MMNCLIVDDEPLALAQLAGYISRIPFLKLIASCQDAHQASKVLASHTIDLLFARPEWNRIRTFTPAGTDDYLHNGLLRICH